MRSQSTGRATGSCATSSSGANVLGSAARLLARVEPEEHAVIWWSNAFFSVWGNWLLDAAERRAAYERWVEELAERNPDSSSCTGPTSRTAA